MQQANREFLAEMKRTCIGVATVELWDTFVQATFGIC